GPVVRLGVRRLGRPHRGRVRGHAGRPDGGTGRVVDDHVAVVLDGHVGTGVPGRPAGPVHVARALAGTAGPVHHEVAVRLHRQPRAVRRGGRVRGPVRLVAGVGHGEVAVQLHGQAEDLVGGGDPVTGAERLPGEQRGGRAAVRVGTPNAGPCRYGGGGETRCGH